MLSRIESLESRTFLSASTLVADEATLSSAVTALPAFAKSDDVTLKSDVAGQTITKADKALAISLDKQTLAKYKTLLKAEASGVSTVNKDVKTLESAKSAKLPAAQTKLEAAATKAQAAVTADSNALLATDNANLTKIGAALPSDTQLQTDIVTLETAGAGRVTGIQTDSATVFTTDVNSLIVVPA